MSHADEAVRLLGMVSQDLEHDLDPQWDMAAARVEALLAIANELHLMNVQSGATR